MNSYFDIHLLPDPEIPSNVLMNSLFAKLHRYLVAHAGLQLGVSFPHYKPEPGGLGCCMRLHGSQVAIAEILSRNWLGGMAGYINMGNPTKLEAPSRYISVRRVQAKSSPARLARRQQARHGLDAEEVQMAYSSVKPERLKLPFLQLRSESTGQVFRMFIKQTESSQPAPGDFNRYGLSVSANLPCR